MSYNYKLKYNLDFAAGSFTKEALREFGQGGTDALFLISLLYPEDGSFSCQIMSVDGRNDAKNLEDIELFKVWALMAHRLAKSETLSEGRRGFADMVFEMHRKMLGH